MAATIQTYGPVELNLRPPGAGVCSATAPLGNVRLVLEALATPYGARVTAIAGGRRGGQAPSARAVMTASHLWRRRPGSSSGTPRRYPTAERVSFKRATHPMKQRPGTDLPPFIRALAAAIEVSAIVGWALQQLVPRQREAIMSPTSDHRAAACRRGASVGAVVATPELDLRVDRGDVDELCRLVALRREEVALLRKLRPES